MQLVLVSVISLTAKQYGRGECLIINERRIFHEWWCDFTHILAAPSSINWPRRLEISFAFSGPILRTERRLEP